MADQLPGQMEVEDCIFLSEAAEFVSLMVSAGLRPGLHLDTREQAADLVGELRAIGIEREQYTLWVRDGRGVRS